jgi:hypothetical protein
MADEIGSDFLYDDSDDEEAIASKVTSYFLSMEAHEEKAIMEEKPNPTEFQYLHIQLTTISVLCLWVMTQVTS